MIKKALNFAIEYINILKCDIDTIHHARKLLLFDESHTWIKKQGLFDVKRVAYDGAKVCELGDMYMLNVLSKKYNKDNFGIYRDDLLAFMKNKSGPQSEQLKKNIQKIFLFFSKWEPFKN